MPGLQTPANLVGLKTRLYKTFQEAMTSVKVQAEEFGLMTDIQSDTETNTYSWLANLEGMAEWIGPLMAEGLKERAFAIRNRHYAKLIEVNKDQLDDSPMTAAGDAAARTQQLVEAGRAITDELVISLLQNGHTTACYDGQFLFDTDHPIDLDSSGTQSNYEASGFALNAANFAAARARMASYKNEGGRSFGVMPDLLVVPPALDITAHTIVTASHGASGASNVTQGMAKVVVLNGLAGQDTTWYLLSTSSRGAKAIIRQKRTELKLVGRTDDTDDPSFIRNVYQWRIDQRLGIGPGAWFKAFKAAA